MQLSHFVAREAEHRDDVSKPAHRLGSNIFVDAVHARRRAGRAEEPSSHDFRNYTENGREGRERKGEDRRERRRHEPSKFSEGGVGFSVLEVGRHANYGRVPLGFEREVTTDTYGEIDHVDGAGVEATVCPS